MPDLRRLRAFVAVAEEGSFTRAAERLFLGQQAVSKSVAALEAELGVALLTRTTRAVRLTPAGEALLERAPAALQALDAAVAAARAAGGALEGRVAVGVTPAIRDGERVAAVTALREGAPDLSVSLVEVRPAVIRAALRDGAVDAVLARTVPPGQGVDSVRLRDTPAALRVPPGHRLAGAGPIALTALTGERLLVHSAPGTPYTDLLLGRLAAAGVHPEVVEARITGPATSMPELAERGAVVLVPAGSDAGTDVLVELLEPFGLPLLLLWAMGAPTPAVARLRAGLGVGV